MNDIDAVQRYFVTPGFEFKDAQTLKTAELSRGEYYVLPDIHFLSALCKEHIRCERVLADELPIIFKVETTLLCSLFDICLCLGYRYQS